ncbi:unannotated protein [freshwater metagenome]|jgi:uncharacterized protein|uniref:Unannotated protein n=1 Tax=freshwater metagenome TaxID=449393 RepID=A0A6J6F1V7_9ZZZZ|nr:DUF501 domain-containing protein [Actinomycetota bacterium]
MSKATQQDLEVVAAQLQRTPRDVHEVAHRCPCGEVDVVATPPRLADGTPFPTFYYATCPKLTAAISTLESSGLMIAMNERLQNDPVLQDAYRQAHIKYESARDAVATELNLNVPEVKGTTAGGMPDRVKCLHSLIAHSLAAGTGVNPLGDEALAALPDWWKNKPCSDLSNLLDKQ